MKVEDFPMTHGHFPFVQTVRSPEGRTFLSFSSKKSGLADFNWLMWLPYPSSRQVLGSQLEKKTTKFCHKNAVAISSNTRKKKGYHLVMTNIAMENHFF
jgi:hypothetical protein